MKFITGLEKIYKCNDVTSVLETYREIILVISAEKCQLPYSLLSDEAVRILTNVVELKITSLITLSLIDKL